MDGLSFYWIFWVFWIIATFFMKKNISRLKIAAWILVVISLSNFSLSAGGIRISVAAFFVLLTAHFVILKEKGKKAVYSFLITYIVMLAFAGLQLMELYDPVWVFFGRKWMFAAFLIYITVLLEKNIHLQIAVLLSGVIYGDILFAIIIRRIAEYHIGSFATMDVVAVSLAVLLVIQGLREASVIFDLYVKHQERGKQKTS